MSCFSDTCLPLQGRRVLVTAGPTWVRIDAVRHLGNVSSGRTGLLIARAAARAGAEVTLILGPGRAGPSEEDRSLLRILDFVTFDELHRAVRAHVGSHAYDALVHTAAVSDYQPVEEEPGKLSSSMEELVIRLRPTPKIVDEVRALDGGILLVKFKLEVGRTAEELLRIADASRTRSDADLIVANDLSTITATAHPAWILDATGVVVHVGTGDELAEGLVRSMAERLEQRPARADTPPVGLTG